ncbi:hypothetical protein WJX73_006114 [Symbiochloris irregularis]|uniref:Beta-amylase n=1 Tax=Symbiochloris irregularis TaxID=706552 RepID=A0AAW1PR57_9CHLO
MEWTQGGALHQHSTKAVSHLTPQPPLQSIRATPARQAQPSKQQLHAVASKAATTDSWRWDYETMQQLRSNEKQLPLAEGNDLWRHTEIFIMLPLGIISVGEMRDGEEASFIHAPSHNAKALDAQFAVLKRAGAAGVMMDVWWGICERHGPKQYDFSAYMQLFKKAAKHGLGVQAVLSFHAGGGNVGDGMTDIPLPPWVLAAGEEKDDEIFYTDKRGGRDHECLSLGCDHAVVLGGRSPLQAYADFAAEFARQCKEHGLWGNVVKEICVGTGPCGELRYPAYQEKGQKWSYMGEKMGVEGQIQVQRGLPGIGEFQCYDKFMLADLKAAAEKVHEPEWGDPPREGAGSYDFCPWETEFFALTKDGGWCLPYGKFFMEWYSKKLVQHGADVIDAVKPAIAAAVSSNGSRSTGKVDLAIKVAGIHWWYKSRSHAAEMTAGYYNYYGHCGYTPIAKALKKRDVGLSFTCIEMSDTENPDLRHCSPEELVKQVVGAAQDQDVQAQQREAQMTSTI